MKLYQIPTHPNYEITKSGVIRNIQKNEIVNTHLNKNGYLYARLCLNGKARGIPLHRLLVSTFIGELKGKEVDHKDGDKLNNQLSNLRISNRSENQCNTPAIRGKYKGVSFDKRRGHYIATISKDYKQYYLGSASTPEEAAHLYNLAAKKLHGEFAYNNHLAMR